MSKLRIHIIVGTLAIVMLLAFGAQKFLYLQQVEKPLNEQFLSIPGVNSVDVTDKKGEKELVTTMGAVEDFSQSYREIREKALAILGDELGTIRVIDQRNRDLASILHASHFAIQEGIATGHFTDMADSVADVMKEHSVDAYRLTVDGDFVYLQVTDDGKFLFSVFPRQSAGPQTVS